MGGLTAAIYLGASAYMLKWTIHFIVQERQEGDLTLSEEIMHDTRKYAGTAASTAACILLFLEGSTEALEIIERFASSTK